MIELSVVSLFVRDQDQALAFYTDVVGFEKRLDIPLGDARWLTVAPPGTASGAVELLLEPCGNPIAKAYQDGLREAGIPATMFAVDDLAAEHTRLTALGTRFVLEPTQAGPVRQAIFDDTCGNLIVLTQVG